MEQYYRNLAEKNRADKKHNNVHVFNIGQGDVEKFPELNGVYQVWLWKDSGIQLIHGKAVINYHQGRKIYD